MMNTFSRAISIAATAVNLALCLWALSVAGGVEEARSVESVAALRDYCRQLNGPTGDVQAASRVLKERDETCDRILFPLRAAVVSNDASVLAHIESELWEQSKAASHASQYGHQLCMGKLLSLLAGGGDARFLAFCSRVLDTPDAAFELKRQILFKLIGANMRAKMLSAISASMRNHLREQTREGDHRFAKECQNAEEVLEASASILRKVARASLDRFVAESREGKISITLGTDLPESARMALLASRLLVMNSIDEALGRDIMSNVVSRIEGPLHDVYGRMSD